MIYLKNIREKQTVNIPRTEINSKVVVIKSYDEGYADGKSAGIEFQKSKLTNLVVSENGLYERENGWNRVEVNVIGDTINTQEKSVTITNDIEEVFPDNGYDALSKVDIDATEFGNKKFSDGHFQGKTEGYEGGKADGIEEGYADGKADGIEEGYNDGYTDGKTDGIEEGYNQGYADGKSESGSCNLIPLNDNPNWEGNNLLSYFPHEYNADGFMFVNIDIGNIYNEGHNQGKSQGVQEGYQNGYIQGKTEGYTEGYEDGMENSTCKLTDLNESPSWDNRDSNNCVTYNPNDYDSEGFSSVKIHIGEVYNVGYQDGITQSQEPEDNILLVKTGRKFTYTDFDELVSWFDFKGCVDMVDMFKDCKQLTVLPQIDTSSASSMEDMFWGCTNLTSIPLLNTVSVTNMSYMFASCKNLTTIPLLNTSNVKMMDGMFSGCINLKTIPQFDTSSVEFMKNMFNGCTSLSYIPALNAGRIIYWDGANIFGNTDLPNLTDFGGFIGLKKTSVGDTGLVRVPNLSYQSCINVLNGLYDFTGTNTKPLSEQGRLQVHKNFLNLVGDQISIATSRGWTITAD